jgi:hypothetical protein
MGLDAVEIVLRVEELFVVEIADDEAASVRTVGDFYVLICAKLEVARLAAPVTSADLPIITHRERVFFSLSRHTPLPAPKEMLPWSAQGVWDCLVAVFVEQQGLQREEIRYNARIVQDLGVG